jgi:hypothetical protein
MSREITTEQRPALGGGTDVLERRLTGEPEVVVGIEMRARQSLRERSPERRRPRA